MTAVAASQHKLVTYGAEVQHHFVTVLPLLVCPHDVSDAALELKPFSFRRSLDRLPERHLCQYDLSVRLLLTELLHAT